MEQWRSVESGMAGERISHLEKPDDPVAHKLVDAAGEAIAQGRVQAGVHILQLVVKDYPLSQEAALSRQALDQIRKQASRGR